MILIAVLASLCAADLSAECKDPWKPPDAKEEEGGQSSNDYATGAKICIVYPTSCVDCRNGYRHVCTAAGAWEPAEPCTDLEIENALKVRGAVATRRGAG